MKVSIITVCYNSALTLEDSILSVSAQSYPDIEHVIVDGGSTDGTVDIIKEYNNSISKWISEPDNGIYDAMNKGIKMAEGEVVGALNADDVYAHNEVIRNVVSCIKANNVDSCYGDLVYVRKNNTGKIIRYWKSGTLTDGAFQRGWMPPHPTFFVKKKVYNDHSCFNVSLKIAADYELMLRFLEKNKITSHYIPDIFVKMRTGGESNRNLGNILMKSVEDYKAWKINDLPGGLYAVVLKNIIKLPQFVKRYSHGSG